MKVLVDGYLPSVKYGGLATYLRNIVPALGWIDGLDITVTMPASQERLWDEDQLGAQINVIYEGVEASPRNDFRRTWYKTALGNVAHRVNPDVLFGPNYGTSATWSGPQVVMVHDALFRRFPDYFSENTRRFLDELTADSVSKASAVLSPSEATAADIRTFWPSDKHIIVSPLAPDPTPARRPVRVTDSLDARPFILNVGGDHHRKRLDTLIVAFDMYCSSSPASTVDFVAIGIEDQALIALRDSLKHAHRIHLYGWVDAATREDLYSHARGFVYCSEWEGFGITPLEALAHGLPVALSRTGALPEVLGNAAAVWVDTTTRLSPWVSAFAALASKPDKGLEQRCEARVARYSWSRTAAITSRALNQAVAAA